MLSLKQGDNDIFAGRHDVLAGLPPESHQGLHVPDNNKGFTTGSCPGAEKKDSSGYICVTSSALGGKRIA